CDGLVDQRDLAARRRYGRLYALAQQAALSRRRGLLADAWPVDPRAQAFRAGFHRASRGTQRRDRPRPRRRRRNDPADRRARLCRSRPETYRRRRPLGLRAAGGVGRTDPRDFRRPAVAGDAVQTRAVTDRCIFILRPSTADSVHALFAREPEGANREERLAGLARTRWNGARHLPMVMPDINLPRPERSRRTQDAIATLSSRPPPFRRHTLACRRFLPRRRTRTGTN